MVDNELFYTLAEIAIALAGFAGVAAGLTRGGEVGLTSEARLTKCLSRSLSLTGMLRSKLIHAPYGRVLCHGGSCVR